jgi:fumarate reductase subunit C
LIIIIAISTVIEKENHTNSIEFIEFIKNPLNIIAIISLFRPFLIIEPSKKELYVNIEEEFKRLKEQDKINTQIEKNACL